MVLQGLSEPEGALEAYEMVLLLVQTGRRDRRMPHLSFSHQKKHDVAMKVSDMSRHTALRNL